MVTKTPIDLIDSGSATDGQVATADGSGGTAFEDLPTSGLTQGTVVATTSGTAIDFTSLPTGLNRITITIDNVSISDASTAIIRLGDTDGFESTAYDSVLIGLDATPSIVSTTVGFYLAGGNASLFADGIAILTRVDGNDWILSSNSKVDATQVQLCVGSKTLSAELDSIRMTTIGGTATFDSGQINIQYE